MRVLRPAKSLLVCAFGVLCACAGPATRIDTDEPDAALYLDGRLEGYGLVRVPHRYYGTSSILALPVRRSPREDVRGPSRTSVTIDAPAPKWLFPLDFFLEAVRRGFAPAAPVDVELALPVPDSSLTVGVRPARADDLRARAARAQTER